MSGKRGAQARLEALEAAERDRVAADVEVKEEWTRRAMARLTPADLDALYEQLDAMEAGTAWWAEICRASATLASVPLEDPAGKATRAWSEALGGIPDGVPFPKPPAGAAAYFRREAARCDTVRANAAGLPLPDDVSLEALQTATLWSGALYRYHVELSLELGEAMQA